MADVFAIRARDITKCFGDVVALENVDLDVPPGQIHGLVGPNGAGKTTLLGLLLGLAVADRGRLEILGIPIGRALAAPGGVAGFVDGPGLYPWLTARQNLAALVALRGRDPRAAGLDDVLAEVGLTEIADDRTHGFSLGMRQRLGLAAALLFEPRLLVLDEPSNGLDPAGKRHVHRVLTRLAAGGAAVVLSSHRMDDVEALCSEVTILATGRVAFSGPLSKLAAEHRDLDYRLFTPDPAVARRVAAGTAGVRIVDGADVLVVRAPVSALDDLVVRLVRAGVAVRGLTPVVSPLEAAYLALTEPATAACPALTEPATAACPALTDPATAACPALTEPATAACPALTDPGDKPMTVTSAGRPVTVSVPRGYRFELMKLVSQWRTRIILLACWAGPAVFVAGVSRQGTLPVDTLFGRWMHATAWAGPLVVLGFAGAYALPLLTSLVAGDVFAAEDRLGTWRHLLVAVRSPRRVFASKVLAGLTVIVLLVAGMPVSGAVGGLVAVGNRPLVGLDGQLLSPSGAAGRVVLAWACALAPTLALAAIGLLGSVALGRSPMGLLLPALVALALQLAQMLPLPVAVRLALPGYAFISWNGLFTSPPQVRPLLVGVVVALVWAVTATALAYLLFVRRDFTTAAYDGSARRAVTYGALPLASLLVVTGLVVAAATGATGSGIDRGTVQRSLATAFGRLYRLQTDELHRPAVTATELRATAACAKGGSAEHGPGNDWRCVVSWRLPGVAATGQAVYQLDITPDGRYVADGDGPKEVNGYFLVRTPDGDAPNPLWQFDGTVELLPKG
jgi:ABC-2 type transport system permease protein